ncbi:MAG: ABC transporter substrate-binding protein [bacterium]|nr:ABC transporter substrate-binding protein [bacterium]
MNIKSIVFTIFVFLAIAVALLYYFITSPSSLIVKETPPKAISILIASDLQLSSVDGVKAGLKELGYQTDKDVTIKLYNPKGDRDLTVKMAQEIVSLKPDLIVTLSTSASSAVIDADKDAKIPLVFGDVGNFQQLGITDIRHPGGFMTGVVVDNVAVAPKRMELLKSLNPNMKTIGVLLNPKHVSYQDILKASGEGAEKLDIKLLWYEISAKEDIAKAMAKLVKEKPDAVMTTSEALISNNPSLITPILRTAKIPSMDFNVEVGVQAGYLMVYGISRFDIGKQSSRIIDKVLKGEDPGSIPIEFASTPSFEINKVLADEMGIDIPEFLLLQANKVYR